MDDKTNIYVDIGLMCLYEMIIMRKASSNHEVSYFPAWNNQEIK